MQSTNHQYLKDLIALRFFSCIMLSRNENIFHFLSIYNHNTLPTYTVPVFYRLIQ